ncbi:DUF4167 domain-containing protein [Ponticoccus sp. SC2-23]|uniref:DUF4167 domain-containing protein n=1 Tax=Alexandriicola marinus TaxID=2081710 RepID=UPI000FDA828A|nr:DUF4167 domain-containing protein [Alexandriicola marinus]MBM1219100.1 DUF4167 domain-containing protein [Ponticoccus sp. SC6-9]MBM1223828.1 DUF4167 domain-containing protein [Ponticoccus sp. SC6-15]MBM1228914.1 DUF4167 domain-containing protein [Ponticoccus sp. SC6-38]MBM1232794.1 DUF4167 domain-containing protein [Ponticoccus sp. SC6-45]MBM1237256.1 DUF4167 domain-containing protein [Ponticoccus sp. SC6-49]MBM1241805.1 DUF4167 domain-containing protein [Ponticoccus sp. SC2-64]MBM1246318
MRSSKSRSRNKNRNNRPSGGNIINRVFDSSGPEGKVRGTPQQIIEKYNQLHRDAQLSGDRVNAENYAQHAEHYTRLLASAQKEVERQRLDQEQANRDRQAERDRERQARLKTQEEVANGGEDNAPHRDEEPQPAQSEQEQKPAPQKRARKPRRQPEPQPDPGSSEQPDVDLGISSVGFLQADDGDSGLVETPEEKAAEAERKPRKPRARKPKADSAADEGPAEAAE